MSTDEIREQISEIKKLTNKPFGVNLVLHWSPEEKLKICLDQGVSVVSFFWNDPSRYTKTAHDYGAITMSTVGSASEGLTVSESGVDVVVAQEWEAGGHVWGKVATMPLTPCVVHRTTDRFVLDERVDLSMPPEGQNYSKSNDSLGVKNRAFRAKSSS